MKPKTPRNRSNLRQWYSYLKEIRKKLSSLYVKELIAQDYPNFLPAINRTTRAAHYYELSMIKRDIDKQVKKLTEGFGYFGERILITKIDELKRKRNGKV